MTIGDANTFLDYVSVGEELYFTYNGKRLFVRGYTDEQVVHGEVWDYDHLEKEPVWNFSGDYADAIDSFLGSTFFNGKKFWDVYKDVTWCENYV